GARPGQWVPRVVRGGAAAGVARCKRGSALRLQAGPVHARVRGDGVDEQLRPGRVAAPAGENRGGAVPRERGRIGRGGKLRSGSPPLRGHEPHGTARGIAGVSNEAGNVVGLLAATENAVEPGFGPSTDGRGFFAPVLGARA